MRWPGLPAAAADDLPPDTVGVGALKRYVSSIQNVWSELEREFQRANTDVDCSASSAFHRIPQSYCVSKEAFRLQECQEFQLLARAADGNSLDKVETELLERFDRYIHYCNLFLEAQVSGDDPSMNSPDRHQTSGVLDESESMLCRMLSEQALLWQRKVRAFHATSVEDAASRMRLELERGWHERVIVALEQVKRLRDTYQATSLFVEHQDLLRAAEMFQTMETNAEHTISMLVSSTEEDADIVRDISPGSDLYQMRPMKQNEPELWGDFRKIRTGLKRKLGAALEHQLIAQFQAVLNAHVVVGKVTKAEARVVTPDQTSSLSLAALSALREETKPLALALFHIGSAGGALYRVPAEMLSELDRLFEDTGKYSDNSPTERLAHLIESSRAFVEGTVVVIDIFYAVSNDMDFEKRNRDDMRRSLPDPRDVLECFLQGFVNRFHEALNRKFLELVPTDGTELGFLFEAMVKGTAFFRFLGSIAETRGATRPASSLALIELQERLTQAIQHCSEQKLQTIQASLDAERWIPTNRTDALQRLADRLVVIAWLGKDTPEGLADANKTQMVPKEALPTVFLLGERFVLIDALENLLEFLNEYVRYFHEAILCETEALTHAISMRVLEALKAFNQRALQLVLGAAAMKNAGLKAITAKHLAVSARSLEFMLKLLHPDEDGHYLGIANWFCQTHRSAPDAGSIAQTTAAGEEKLAKTTASGCLQRYAIRSSAESSRNESTEGHLDISANSNAQRLPARAISTEAKEKSPLRDPVLEQAFARTLADYEVHRSQLLNKIGVIMQGRLRNRIAELRHFSWHDHSLTWQEKRPEASPWVLSLMKDLTTLCRILSPILSVSAQCHVFQQILYSYATSLRDEFAQLTEEYLSTNHGASGSDDQQTAETARVVLLQLAADTAVVAEVARSLDLPWDANAEPPCLSELDALARTYQNLAEKQPPGLSSATETQVIATDLPSSTD
jgi:hypothetical protein